MYPKTLSALLMLASATALAACGGGDSSTAPQTEVGAASTAASTSASTTSGERLEIAMGDDFFNPSDATAKAGTVTINATNTGDLVHELVLAETNVDPAELPTTSDGSVDEAKLEAQGASAGEIADVAPGASKSGDLKLSPGTYAMYCNVPGHYAAGMFGTLTVK